jgi:Carboxypeptidase regulatory-like domain/TonB dependent receptor-like, beta-barrel
MRSRTGGLTVVIFAILSLPGMGYAQEATLSGRVTDSTGGVLPGVTVSAVNEASGNSFTAVTDERGEFRIPARIGIYRITAELQGFAAATRGLELLVGQQAVVNLQLSPSVVQETVTVTGEAPLIDVTQSSLSGNVDPRQMEALPINGRNWQDLVVLAPGNRTNAVQDRPTARERGDYQINMDGQQVTTNLTGAGQGNPAYSRDAIAEFEFVASRFNALQGRSSGVQVNAVTKSGTNAFAGSLSGYFRDDRFNAADFIQKRVLPYSDRQISTTFGGPIRKDRIHFFGNYEYEGEPRTITFTSPYPSFNIDLTGKRVRHIEGVRLDFQLSSATRLMMRGNWYYEKQPYNDAGGALRHPSSSSTGYRRDDQGFASLTQVLSNRAVNEIRGGYASFYYQNKGTVDWPNHPYASSGITKGTPQINFSGYRIGIDNANYPQELGQQNYNIRDDFTYSFSTHGRHDVKVGGEYLQTWQWLFNTRNGGGVYDAMGGAIPANVEQLFPVWNDISSWNLNALNPIIRRYTWVTGDLHGYVRHHYASGWLQDDWAFSPRLTLNLGVRYDLETDFMVNNVAVAPLFDAGRPNDKDNVAPRLGVAYTLNDRTVLRGGWGKYFGEILNMYNSFTISASRQFPPEVTNDGRPDFAANPFNGPRPTFEQMEQRAAAGQFVRATVGNLIDPFGQMSYSYQGSIGLQRQIGTTMSVEADYAFTQGRHEISSGRNDNLSYDPVTGVNYPFSDVSKRPIPGWGIVQTLDLNGRSDLHQLQTAFTKRLSHRWQASGTYTLSGLWDAEAPRRSGVCADCEVNFKLAQDLGDEYTLAVSDQRHRAVFNGIWEPGLGFQVSGLYFYGFGERMSTNAGTDRRNCGSGCNRLRADGTIVPRNAFVGKPLHRVDMRVQRRFQFSRRAAVDGILEVFNFFNHANYGSYTLAESNLQYGKPSQNSNVAYQPRMVQLGFRAIF